MLASINGDIIAKTHFKWVVSQDNYFLLDELESVKTSSVWATFDGNYFNTCQISVYYTSVEFW